MFFSFVVITIPTFFFQKGFINSCLENLTLILFKMYEISFEEIKILKKYQQRKKRTSEYISQPQTNKMCNFL